MLRLDEFISEVRALRAYLTETVAESTDPVTSESCARADAAAQELLADLTLLRDRILAGPA